MFEITVNDLTSVEIQDFLAQHIQDMQATSPPESKHALDIEALRQPDIQFWSAYEDQQLLGCVALKTHISGIGEIKSMRTAIDARGRGVGIKLLEFLLESAKQNGIRQIYLETGSMEFFEPARKLYLKYGFEKCGPFADYKSDPNSVFMTKKL